MAENYFHWNIGYFQAFRLFCFFHLWELVRAHTSSHKWKKVICRVTDGLMKWLIIIQYHSNILEWSQALGMIGEDWSILFCDCLIEVNKVLNFVLCLFAAVSTVIKLAQAGVHERELWVDKWRSRQVHPGHSPGKSIHNSQSQAQTCLSGCEPFN